MVDKLRKFGEMLWLNKERMILVAMLAILCYQVYEVVYPDERPRGTIPKRPGDADVATKPPQPPDKPSITISGDYVGLFRRNPFWYASGRNQRNTTSTSSDIVIKLLDIQDLSGRQRARLQTETTTKWYDVGEKFEQFQLQSVDEAAGTATVYVESQGKEVTIQKE